MSVADKSSVTVFRTVRPKEEQNKKSHIEKLDEGKLKYVCKECEEGKTYGYRDLCRALDLPILPSGSNTQKSQLKNLGNYCDIKKEGDKFTISNPRTNEPIRSNKKPNTVMTKFGLGREASTSPCIYAIYSLESSKCVVGKTKNFNKLYTQWEYRNEAAPVYEGILNEDHDIQLWTPQGEDGLPEQSKCIQEMKDRGYVVIDGNQKGRKALQEFKEEQLFKDLYIAVDHACERYGWSPTDFLDRLVFHIEKNPGNWMNNTIMFMATSSFMRDNQLKYAKGGFAEAGDEEFPMEYGNDYGMDFDGIEDYD